MNRARVDLTYSALQYDPRDECCRVCGPEGWHVLHAGDAVKFPGGLVISIDGPAQFGGGTLKAGALAVLAGFLALVVAGWMGVGKGSGL